MKMICSLCGKTIALSQDGKLPPWCPGCGVDLKSGPMAVASADAPVLLSSADEHELKDRFGVHNLGVGILLFVWGLVVTAGPPQSGGDKVLKSKERLNHLIDAVQIVALVNGAVLAASGLAIRRRWWWGCPLAVGCGIVSVVAGFIFLACFRSLSGGTTLEDGVAQVSFIRYNFDMLIGLVDGLGLLWFVSTRLSRARISNNS